MSGNHVVSCEPCKRKKCKCDRKLPCCSQCNALPSFCKYYHNNKRGIPGGYLNALEQRLDETENALHTTLAELRALKPDDYANHEEKNASISGRRANATKGARMAEWKTLPLKTPRDLQQWWETVQNTNGDQRSSPRNQNYDLSNEAPHFQPQAQLSQQHDSNEEIEPLGEDSSAITNNPTTTSETMLESLSTSHDISTSQLGAASMNTNFQDYDGGVGDRSNRVFNVHEETSNDKISGMEIEQSYTANAQQARTTALTTVTSSATELSKSQQLTRAMNHMYY